MGTASSYENCPLCGEREMHMTVDTHSFESWGTCQNCGAHHENGIVTPRNNESEQVEFGEDYIAIYDESGEVVRWLKQEWVEDPEVVFSIANAVRIIYGEPNETVREMISRDEV